MMIRKRKATAIVGLSLGLLVAPAMMFPPPSSAESTSHTAASSVVQDDYEYADDVSEPEHGTEDDDQLETDQGVTDRFEEIEEITVVGQASREDLLQHESSSIVSFDTEDIVKERMSDLRDVSDFTPNLQISSSFGVANPVIFIRGVGIDDPNANAASAVAVYQDGVYLNTPAKQLFLLSDIQSVEVLRGPQGIRYRNASAGKISVLSIEPRDEFETWGSLAYGNYNLWDASGALNVPIVEDRVKSRFSFRLQRRDGTTFNRCGTAPLMPFDTRGVACKRGPPGFIGSDLAFVPERVNNIDNWTVRGMVGGTIELGAGDLEWLVKGHAGATKALAAQFQHTGAKRFNAGGEKVVGTPDADNYIDLDNDPYAGDYNLVTPERVDLHGASIRLEWSPSVDHELYSLTAYEWHDRVVSLNTDANPLNTLQNDLTDKAWQATQDLKLLSEWTGNVRTETGALVLFENLVASNRFESAENVVFRSIFFQNARQETRAASTYLAVEWDPWEVLTVDVGARYSYEYKKFKNDAFATVLLRNGSTLLPRGKEQTSSQGFHGWSGSLTLTYHIDDDRDVYAKYGRGWKPGAFNGGAVLATQFIEPVNPETIDSIEVGLRTQWWDRRLTVNVAAFFYAYDDLQVFRVETDRNGNPVSQLANANDAEIYGLEFDFTAAPVEGLSLRYNFGWLSSEYLDFRTTVDRSVPIQGRPPLTVSRGVNYSGNRLTNSPDCQMAGSIQYTLPLFGWTELEPRFSFRWTDDVFFDPAEGRGTEIDLPYATIGQPAYSLLNAQLTYRFYLSRSVIDVTGWVRNIRDTVYTVTAYDATLQAGLIARSIGDPRTYGITLNVYYE